MGPASSRNGSEIAAVVKDVGRRWLLTGDAGYHEVGTLPATPAAIVVPHRGADMGTSSVPPSKPTGYTRLSIRSRPGNWHGRKKPSVPSIRRPPPSLRTRHGGTARGPANRPAISSPAGTSHERGNSSQFAFGRVAVAWSSAPSVPLGQFTCASCGASSICRHDDAGMMRRLSSSRSVADEMRAKTLDFCPPIKDGTSRCPSINSWTNHPDSPREGIALAMSGGGYRAMVFHVGALIRPQ